MTLAPRLWAPCIRCVYFGRARRGGVTDALRMSKGVDARGGTRASVSSDASNVDQRLSGPGPRCQTTMPLPDAHDPEFPLLPVCSFPWGTSDKLSDTYDNLPGLDYAGNYSSRSSQQALSAKAATQVSMPSRSSFSGQLILSPCKKKVQNVTSSTLGTPMSVRNVDRRQRHHLNYGFYTGDRWNSHGSRVSLSNASTRFSWIPLIFMAPTLS